MPILWLGEVAADVIASGEAQSIIGELNVGAALAAAGWFISAGIALWQTAGSPAMVTGINFVWTTTTGGGDNPPPV